MNNTIVQYEFDNYVLLPAERLLLQDGHSIALQSKVFETLLIFVKHHGQLLTKEELMERIWGDNFVEEGNLSQNVFTLRKLFGEKPHDHHFIVTVPGHGYRFVAKVREISKSEDEKLYKTFSHSGNGYVKSLAILPLTLLTPNEAENKKHLGLAIADTLITQLSAKSTVSIRSTEAALKHTETKRDPISIGRELAVDMILSGTIQTSDKKIRINIQLYDTKTGNTLWADKFEFQSNDFFELQDQISGQVAAALTTELDKNSPGQKILKDSETYQAYLKYRFFWETRSESGLLKSLNGAKEIVAAKPDFPLGYIAVADSYLLLGHHLYLAPDKVYPAVRMAVEKALKLDSQLAEAYTTKADYCFINKDWAQAERLHQLAVKLKPNYASAWHWYSWFLMAMGRYDESFIQIEQAQLLDKNSLYLSTIRGVPFYYKNLFDQAINQFRLVLEIDPNYNRARYYLALALFHSGETETGIAEFEKLVAAEPIQQTIALLGYCYGVAGMRSEAREMLRLLNQIESKRYVSPYIRAYIHTGLGEKKQALTELEKAFDENAIWLIWLNIDLNFNSLRDEPRFKDLIKKMNFPVSAG